MRRGFQMAKPAPNYGGVGSKLSLQADYPINVQFLASSSEAVGTGYFHRQATELDDPWL